MTTSPAIPAPERVGQGTAVEQSRAAAEVLGAIEAARRWPRDVQQARRDLFDSCGLMSVAESARYEYRRGGETVTGPTVALLREIARCWQHIHHGITELRRDEEYGQSEVMAYAWDVQGAVRSSRTFILPHSRYQPKGGGRGERLVDLRDIQENNVSVGGRNVRECIASVLPPWLLLEADELCRTTLAEGEIGPDRKRKPQLPLPKRVGDAIEKFEALGVTERQLEARQDRASSAWRLSDVVSLGNLYGSIQRGETTVKAEFPPAVITGAQIIASAPPEPTVDAISPAATSELDTSTGTDGS